MINKEAAMSAIKKGAQNLGYLAVGTVITFAAADTTFGAINTAGTYAKNIKETLDPTPIKVQKGWGPFAKTSTITVNPWTGKVSQYKGTKSAINKKPIRV